jgi:hypothetical protein
MTEDMVSRKVSVVMRCSDSTAKLITEQKSDMTVQAWVSSSSMSSKVIAGLYWENVANGFVNLRSDVRAGYVKDSRNDGLLKNVGLEPL